MRAGSVADLERLLDSDPATLSPADRAMLDDLVQRATTTPGHRLELDGASVDFNVVSLSPSVGGFVHSDADVALCHGPRREGKALPAGAPVLTPTGWVKIGDLRPGDPVIAGDGSVVAVLGVYPQGVCPMWRLRFSDGTSAVCTDDHLWAVETAWDREGGAEADPRRAQRKAAGKRPKTGRSRRGQRVVSTREIRARLDAGAWKSGGRWSIPALTAPAALAAREVPLDPYVLGALLGDGGLTNPETLLLTTADQELVDEVSRHLPAGASLRHSDRYTYRVVGDGRLNPTLRLLKAMGVHGHLSHQKSVPEGYLWNDAATRLAILQGLLDTDGTVLRHSNSVSYSTTSTRLAENVEFLVRSLGGMASCRPRQTHYTYAGEQRAGRPSHHVAVSLPSAIAPFRLSRKLARVRPKGLRNAGKRYIVAAEPEPDAEAVCLRVDHPSGLFLTENFVVTHNTTGGVSRVLRVGSAVPEPFLPLPVAVVRDTWTSLERTTIKTIRSGARLGWWDAQFIEGDTQCLLNDGLAHLYFFGMDREADANKFQGFEAGIVWIEEPAPAADLLSGVPEAVFGMALTSLSYRGCRPSIQITMNPPDEDHWTVHLVDRLVAMNRPEMRVETFWIRPGENRHVDDDYRVKMRLGLEAIERWDLIGRLVEGHVGTVKQGIPVTPNFSQQHVAAELRVSPLFDSYRFWDFGLNPTCLPAGTRVVLADGRVERIENIRPGAVVLAVHGATPSILGPAKVARQGVTGCKPCLTIRTRHQELRLTADHRVLCIRPVAGVGFAGRHARTAEWVEAGQLRRGDEVVIARPAMIGGQDYTLKESRLPVTPAMAELLGAFAGDGSLLRKDARPVAVDFSAYDERIEARWVALGTEVLGRPARTFKGRVILGSAALARDLEAEGLGARSTVRRLPAWVFALPLEHRLRVLRGYLDADGYVTGQGDIRVMAVNEDLVWDLWALCRTVGIAVQPVRRRENKTRWTASGRRTVWGFVSRDTAWLHVGSTKWGDRIRARVHADRTRRLGAGLDIEKVVSVTAGTVAEPVYDIEVEGAHTFVAQGIVVHNCVWVQITPLGHVNVIGAVVGENIGVEQLIQQRVLPWQRKHRMMPGRGARDPFHRGRKAEWRWRDIGDPAGKAREQSNSERTAAKTLERLLGTSFEPGPVPWSARRDSAKWVLNQMRDGRPMVMVDRDEAQPLIKALSGGWHYHKSSAGVISPLPVKNISSHPGDAWAYGMAELFPVDEFRLLPEGRGDGVQVARRPPPSSYMGV